MVYPNFRHSFWFFAKYRKGDLYYTTCNSFLRTILKYACIQSTKYLFGYHLILSPTKSFGIHPCVHHTQMQTKPTFRMHDGKVRCDWQFKKQTQLRIWEDVRRAKRFLQPLSHCCAVKYIHQNERF